MKIKSDLWFKINSEAFRFGELTASLTARNVSF